MNPDSRHYYRIKYLAISSLGSFSVRCFGSLWWAQRKQRTDSSFLIIRVLIWTPCSFKFKATLLLLGPQKQSGALSGSPGCVASALCVTWTPLAADGRLALDGSNRVARQQAGLHLNKQVSLGLSAHAQNGQCRWARRSGWSQNINHRIMQAMFMNQLLQINKLRSFREPQYWFFSFFFFSSATNSDVSMSHAAELSQEAAGNGHLTTTSAFQIN